MKKEIPLNFSENMQLYLQFGIDVNGRCISISDENSTDSINISNLDSVIRGVSILEDVSIKEPIDFIITSSGGEMDVGMGIYDVIRATQAPTRIYTVGKCYSMGTIILQAGNERYSFPNTKFMIHEGTIDFQGASTPKHAKIELAEMQESVDLMYKIYEESTYLSKKELSALMGNKDYCFSATKALELGFVDAIVDKI